MVTSTLFDNICMRFSDTKVNIPTASIFSNIVVAFSVGGGGGEGELYSSDEVGNLMPSNMFYR